MAQVPINAPNMGNEIGDSFNPGMFTEATSIQNPTINR
jgi:hypothetical protein